MSQKKKNVFVTITNTKTMFEIRHLKIISMDIYTTLIANPFLFLFFSGNFIVHLFPFFNPLSLPYNEATPTFSFEYNTNYSICIAKTCFNFIYFIF